MKFFSRNNYPETIPCPECSKEQPTFTLKINKETGKKELVKTGTTNIYEKIQAAKDETLIYNILEKFERGDTEILKKMRGTYGDFREMPKTLAEAQQTLIDAENTFNSLPLDIRREFNMNPSEFITSLGNGKFNQIMAKIQPNKQEAKIQPNKQEIKVEQSNPGTNLQLKEQQHE